jgi:hypothetical protein
MKNAFYERCLNAFKVWQNIWKQSQQTNCNLENKSTQNLGYACYHSGQKPSSSDLLSKNIIKMHTIIILPVVLYGCETLSLILKRNTGKGW